MAVFIACSVLFLAMTGRSDAAYCLCKDGVSTDQLQKNIDYACGAGANCSPILQNGACFNPNTVKDHCNYAVNSYYQGKGQTATSCDFLGTATTSPTAPSNVPSTCTYPASASAVGTTTPTNNASTSPSTPNNAPPGTTLNPGSTGNPTLGIGPSGTGVTNQENVGSSLHHNLLTSLAATLLLLAGLMLSHLRV